MELGLLNLMSPGTGADDAGTLAPGAVDADAFAKLIAQLGLAPAAGDATPATPESFAARLAAGVAPAPTAKAPMTDAAPAAETGPEAKGDRAAPEKDGPIDLASLGLPPLLAALVAPAAAAPSAPSDPVATAEAAGKAGVAATPTTAAAIPTTAGADDLLATIRPSAQPKAGPDIDQRAVPVELPAPLAALVSAAMPRRPAPTSLPAAPAQPVTGDAAATPIEAAAPVLPTPILTPALPTARTEAAPTAPTAEPVQVAELMAERQLDLARGGEWLDQLAKDIARTSSGEGPLRFRLNPEHLGSLHVELTQGSAGASLRLTADSEAARAIIADARPQLIAEARAQGVRIAEAHVDLGSGAGSGGASGGPAGQGGNAPRDGRAAPDQSYLTTWKPESVEETPTTPRRSASERYA